jgi:hypothetical protein
LPAKNGQQSAVNTNDAQMNKFVHQHWASSTPLRTTTTPVTFTSPSLSPVKQVMSQSTVKTRRGKGSPVAESEKM